jgi:hypothetical protein
MYRLLRKAERFT